MATDKTEQLGMVGLGRMGAGIVRRLMRDVHRCVGYDVNADVISALERDGMAGATLTRGVRGKAPEAPHRLDHGSRGGDHREDDRQRRRRVRVRRRDHRWR